MAALGVDALIPDWSAFLREHWGRKPYARALSTPVLEQLLGGFEDGEPAELISRCRKPDNTRYSAEECEEMQRDLEAHARTLNLPYCFSRGARELELAFVEACGARANDSVCRGLEPLTSGLC